jgi:MipA family protein
LLTSGHPLLVAALLAASLRPAPTQAAQEPLWELGLGIGALGYADYRGADSSHVWPVPIPYISYNGPFLKADQEGLHGALFHRKWVELNLSWDATTPVSNDRTRNGTPELKPTMEGGVSLDFHLWRSDDARMKLDFKVPVRSVFTIEAPPRAIGWTLTPGIDVKLTQPDGWKVEFFTGPLFANKHYNDYFYSVLPQQATPSRPAYEAPGGYAGTQFNWTFTKRFPNYWIGAYMRYDTLSGAVFVNSPLVARNYYWSAGFGIAWIIGRSSRMVEVNP